MQLWEAMELKEPEIISFVGAGGKTSLMLALAAEARRKQKRILVSATTKLLYSQVVSLNPVFSNDFSAGLKEVFSVMKDGGSAAWFQCRQQEKVCGLLPEWLDATAEADKGLFILVEADGARGKWLKAPALHEPVLPTHTAISAGVLNLQAIGRPLTEQIVHRPELVLAILQKREQEVITWQDIVHLATKEQGIFQYAQGKKMLILTGADSATREQRRQIAEGIRRTGEGITKCLMLDKHEAAVELVEVYRL